MFLLYLWSGSGFSLTISFILFYFFFTQTSNPFKWQLLSVTFAELSGTNFPFLFCFMVQSSVLYLYLSIYLSSIYLSIYLYTYLPIYQSSIYHLSIYHLCLSSYLSSDYISKIQTFIFLVSFTLVNDSNIHS